jgi:hypothetical protein
MLSKQNHTISTVLFFEHTITNWNQVLSFIDRQNTTNINTSSTLHVKMDLLEVEIWHLTEWDIGTK